MSPGAAELRRHDNGRVARRQGVRGRRGARGVGVPADVTPDAEDARLVLAHVGVATWSDCPEDAAFLQAELLERLETGRDNDNDLVAHAHRWARGVLALLPHHLVRLH